MPKPEPGLILIVVRCGCGEKHILSNKDKNKLGIYGKSIKFKCPKGQVRSVRL